MDRRQTLVGHAVRALCALPPAPVKHDAPAFLQFCLRLYSHAGMREVCLHLQNSAGANVNCLLLAAWAARAGYSIDSALWADLQQHTATIRETAVQPIRALRKQISKEPRLNEDLRGPIKRLLLYAELRAEQAEEHALHNRMAGLAARAPAGEALFRQNLDALAIDAPQVESFYHLTLESGLLNPRS
ncbi:TIGR02444 family protein [Paludibaculum fermentans]|uniref:TIGR02444 family protein n=1 Tax=Paludibaculum fermentans TaxID=1473598 RepID=A0A7S7SKV0_PALFE|nr:TIGR02444 family protein [Paludibaculum fermentans]QOY87430.1 TIGR02444 family protein [Paludibaculum fermentans]